MQTTEQEPAAIVDALFWEYGLEEIRPYTPDLIANMKDCIRWHRLRGTPDSVHIAMRWIGFPQLEIQEFGGALFTNYQVRLRAPLLRDFLTPASSVHHSASSLYKTKMSAAARQKKWHHHIGAMAKVNALSAPLRAHLSRLVQYKYEGDNRKVLRFEEGENGFGQILSDVEGIDHPSGMRVCFVAYHESSLSLTYRLNQGDYKHRLVLLSQQSVAKKPPYQKNQPRKRQVKHLQRKKQYAKLKVDFITHF